MRQDGLNRIVEDLRSSDLVRQVTALDEYFVLPSASISDADRNAVLSAGVDAIETAANPLLIMERLFRFGKDAEAPLIELLNRGSSSKDAKGIAALILLKLGSRTGVPVLVEEFERGGEVGNMVSSALAHAGIADHVPLIIERLRHWETPIGSDVPTDGDMVVLSLIKDLTKLRVQVPEDLRAKFLGPQTAPWFRSAFERSCVAKSES